MNAPAPQLLGRGRVVGEPMVWLTSMGLCVGALMVAIILGVIVFNGIGSFWPHRVQQITLANGETWMGVETKRQERRGKPDQPPIEEIQLYHANRWMTGQSFKFFDTSSITATTLPEAVMMVEQIKNGNALGFPVRLQMKGQADIMATGATFDARLEELIGDCAAHRAEIRVIVKGKIGKNSADLSNSQRTLKALSETLSAEDRAKLENKIAKLQAESDEYSAATKRLGGTMNDNVLVLRTANGKETNVSVGNIIGMHYPNKLGLAGRFGRFLRNIWVFASEDPREANTEGGIFPAIFGTFVMTMLMSVMVVPFGVLAAIYLREYAKQGPFVRAVRIAINNLAGVPSIVFGVFGLGFFVYFVGGHIDAWFFHDKLPAPTFGTGGILWASLTLALMTVPVVIVATEEAVAAVPRGMREGSLAIGSSKWQMIQTIVLPASIPGILTGAILAMARGAGEVAPLMLTGVVKLAPSLPIDLDFPFVHLDQKFMHLGFAIYDLGFQSPDSEAARPMVFATTLFLILLVMLLNLGAILLRERLRRRYASSAF